MKSESIGATAQIPAGKSTWRIGAKPAQPGDESCAGPATGPHLHFRRPKSTLSPLVPAFILRLFDLTAIGLPGLVVYLAYVYPPEAALNGRYIAAILLAVVAASVFLQWTSVYSEDRIFSRRPRIGRVLAAWAILCCAFLACAFALKISSSYSRVWVTLWFFSTCGLLVLGRLILDRWIFRSIQQGRFALATVILGAGENGQRLAAYLDQKGDARTRIIGFVDDRRSRVPPCPAGHRLIGDTEDLVRLIRRGGVDDVFIALPLHAERRVREVLSRLDVMPVRICLVPDLAGFQSSPWSFTQVAGLPMARVQDRPLSGWSYTAKVVEDFVIAAALLLLLGPLLLLIALAIKIDSPGPVFFNQQRYGFNSQLFRLWKFRTMHVNATDADCAIQTTRNDPRVTRVGRFLRRSSLDELPQLINVLRGEMSIVGPRPHAVLTKAEGRLFEEIVQRYAARHKVKPGITGWAQVNGWRGETDTVEKIQKRVEHDLYYIDHWVIWLDLKILLKTVMLVFKDEKAY